MVNLVFVLSDVYNYLGLLGILPRDDYATADTEMYVLNAFNDVIDTNEAGNVQDLKNAIKEIRNIASATNDPVFNVVQINPKFRVQSPCRSKARRKVTLQIIQDCIENQDAVFRGSS